MSAGERLTPTEGARVPDGELVFRLYRRRLVHPPTAVPPQAFELSDDDMKQTPPRLSLWSLTLTTGEQAAAIFGDNADALVRFTLAADEIRGIRADPPHEAMPGLDVVWERATREVDGARVPDDRPGAEGHVGIEGLARPSGVPRSVSRSYRSQLADHATARGVVLANGQPPT